MSFHLMPYADLDLQVSFALEVELLCFGNQRSSKPLNG